MSFGLKNTGAAHQCAIQECRSSQIRHNAEAYMDNVVIKTQSPDTLIKDLAETFANL